MLTSKSSSVARSAIQATLVLAVSLIPISAGAQSVGPARTLICRPIDVPADSAEGLYRCAPAAISDGEIVATAPPTELTLQRSEYEALRQEIALLRAALERRAPPSTRTLDPASAAPGSETPSDPSPPLPTNDLLWRTPAPAPPDTSSERAPDPDLKPNPGPGPGPAPSTASERHRFSILDASAGGGDGGGVNVSLGGRYFTRLDDHLAVQAQGSLLYYDERQEIEIDLGLVNRLGQLQLGLFGSVKHVGLEDFETAATLAQVSLTADWVFARGRLGLFGTAGVNDQDTIARETPVGASRRETFIEVVDQLGLAARWPVLGKAYLDASAALLQTSGDDELGGSLRLVYPVKDRWAITAEASLNPTRVSPSDDETRFALGLRTGDWRTPAGSGEAPCVMPAEVPSVRYEVRTRERRLSNLFPVADAGPDQRLTASCPGTDCAIEVILDGTGSSDPEGDALTFSWTPRSGFDTGQEIESADQPVARFTAREGGRYIVRLTVSEGELQSSDDVAIVVEERPAVRIERFRSSPKRIRAGESAVLEWRVADATEVTLRKGSRAPRPVASDLGSTVVRPKKTTVYTLEARNAVSVDRRTITITVR